jgi:serine protease Do
MRFALVLAALAACLATANATAQPIETAPLSVARIVSTLQEGQTWGQFSFGPLCLPAAGLAWGVGRGKLNVRAFEAPARAELKHEGFTVKGDPSDPFDERTSNFAIGGTITDIHGDFCDLNVRFIPGIKGSATIEIEWQLYSMVDRKTLARGRTSGAAKITKSQEGAFQTVLIDAMRDSLSKFMNREDIKVLISTPAPSPHPPAALASASPIALTGSVAAKSAKIADAVGSVVLVLSGGGHGSGFLVSSDGYLLTAEHVVGSDKYVKIRWSDGLEGVGEVVRADKRRDVAIIKTDPRGRQPLALHRAPPDPGDTVFAIGAPLDVKYQSTVTRGVASANRIMDGFSFIQSDVTISPGNSGGPLLDEKGEVLGICDLTFRPAGADVPTGINYFVPIDDALRFLAADPK